MVKKAVVLAVVAALMVTVIALPTAPTRAANVPLINAFHATCTNFSVSVALAGNTNDANGFDRFRFLVTDGNGKKLYQEDTARQTGAVVEGRVANLSYDADGVADGLPQANPIRFSIVDLDMLGNPIGTVASLAVPSACLAPISRAETLLSLLPQGVKGTVRLETALYPTPRAAPLSLSVQPGHELTAIYRTNDNAWIAVYVGGENLVWLPAGAFNVDMNRLSFMPTSIDRSQQVTGAIIIGAPVASALVRYTVRFRAGPSTTASIIGRVPFGVTVAVYGRSANSGWLAINYNGVIGWVAARFLRLNGVRLSDLPIVG